MANSFTALNINDTQYDINFNGNMNIVLGSDDGYGKWFKWMELDRTTQKPSWFQRAQNLEMLLAVNQNYVTSNSNTRNCIGILYINLRSENGYHIWNCRWLTRGRDLYEKCIGIVSTLDKIQIYAYVQPNQYNRVAIDILRTWGTFDTKFSKEQLDECITWVNEEFEDPAPTFTYYSLDDVNTKCIDPYAYRQIDTPPTLGGSSLGSVQTITYTMRDSGNYLIASCSKNNAYEWPVVKIKMYMTEWIGTQFSNSAIMDCIFNFRRNTVEGNGFVGYKFGSATDIDLTVRETNDDYLLYCNCPGLYPAAILELTALQGSSKVVFYDKEKILDSTLLGTLIHSANEELRCNVVGTTLYM